MTQSVIYLTQQMDEINDLQNSLEDWIAIKANLFADQQKSDKFNFLVAFNHVDNIVAITGIEKTRKAKDKYIKSMATSLSPENLVNINRQLSSVRPELNQYFKPIEELIPTRNRNSSPKSDDLNEECLCLRIQQYLEESLSLCGRKLLFTVLFDVDFLADFEEDIQELRQKGFENLVDNAIEELKEVMNYRTNVETLLQMTTVYAIEDQVIANASIALAELYNFRLQPFLKLREISSESMKKSQEVINDPDLGHRIKSEALQVFNEFKDQFLSSSEALQQLYQDYYRKTIELISGQTQRMKCDQKRFGESAFQVKGCLNRLQNLELFLIEERLKLLNSIKITKEFQKSQIQQQLNENQMNCDLKPNETELFEIEINVLDSKLDIIAEEEKLIKQKILILEIESKRKENIEEFFDAIEDEKEMESLAVNKSYDPSKDYKKLSALKTKLNKLYRKRAFLRNKRLSLLSNKSSKKSNDIKEKQNFESNNKIELKPKTKSIQSKTNNEKFDKIRRKTLERLRNYKLKSLLIKDYGSDEISNVKEELPLPPYPQNSGQQISDNLNEIPLPLPPNCVTNSPELQSLNWVPLPPKFGAPVPPSLSPPLIPVPPSAPQTYVSSIPVLPPPPPPPPPPNSSSQTFIMKKSEKKVNSKPENNENKTSIDLKDILEMRNKLKKTSVTKQSTQTPNDLIKALKGSLNKIRNVVQTSDSSEDESDSDFDQNY